MIGGRGRFRAAPNFIAAFPMPLLIQLLKSTLGASAAEYALILAIVGVGIAGAALALGISIADSFEVTAGYLD